MTFQTQDTPHIPDAHDLKVGESQAQPVGVPEFLIPAQETRYSPSTVTKITTLSRDVVKSFEASAGLLGHPV